MSPALRSTRSHSIRFSPLSLPSFDGLAAPAIARVRVPGVPFLFFSGTMGEDAAIIILVNEAREYVLMVTFPG